VNKEVEAIRHEVARVRQEVSDEHVAWMSEAGEKFTNLGSEIQSLGQEARRRATRVDGELNEFRSQVIEIRRDRNPVTPDQNACQSSCSREPPCDNNHTALGQQPERDPLGVRYVMLVNGNEVQEIADGQCMQNESNCVSEPPNSNLNFRANSQNIITSDIPRSRSRRPDILFDVFVVFLSPFRRMPG
jgi:hypothetical protein